MSDTRERAQAFVDADDNPSLLLTDIKEVRGHWAKLGGWAETGEGDVAWVECWYDFSIDPPKLWGRGKDPPTEA